jgi:hypothetical protein
MKACRLRVREELRELLDVLPLVADDHETVADSEATVNRARRGRHRWIIDGGIPRPNAWLS